MKHRLNTLTENYLISDSSLPRLIAIFPSSATGNNANNAVYVGRKTMKKLLITLAFGAFATTGAMAESSFQTVDADTDGSVTYAEAVNAGMPWSEDQFQKADINSDGVLDEEEFKAALL
ncbi:MAG: EF-hand domain-containing protein [Pseudomonadota bacterium]